MIYSPAEDSFLLAEVVKKYARGKRVLDVGSGGGIQAETALNAGAERVLALEIDEESLRLLKKKRIEARKSDLFSAVRNEKFDLIIFNPPYLPKDGREDEKSARITSGGENGDEIIVRFLKDVKNYLEKNGKIILVVSSLTPLKRIKKILKDKKLKKKVAASEKYFMELLEVWEMSRTNHQSGERVLGS